MKVRKKPVEVEAERWNQKGDVEYAKIQPLEGEWICYQCNHPARKHGNCPTLEGWHIVCPGDWIVTGIKGEHYPCKPDIFAETYEVAEP